MLEVSPVSRFAMDTADPERAHAWVSDTYTGRPPRLSLGRDGFRMQVNGLVTDLLRIDQARHTARAEVDNEAPRRVHVNRVRRGRYRTSGRRSTITRGPGDVAMIDPVAPCSTAWESLDLEVVSLDEAAASQVAAGLSGLATEQVRFGLVVPRDEAWAGYWCRTVDHVTRHVLDDDAAAGEPLLRAEAFRSLATAATLVFPNTALEALLDPQGRPSGLTEPATVRRAVEFMDAHAGQPIGPTEIAEAARVGARALQAAFRRHRGQTPLDYLRRVRLEHAHQDLQDAEAGGGVTVAGVAARWGFAHPGRFAVEYREAYGRSPSATLRR